MLCEAFSTVIIKNMKNLHKKYDQSTSCKTRVFIQFTKSYLNHHIPLHANVVHYLLISFYITHTSWHV